MEQPAAHRPIGVTLAIRGMKLLVEGAGVIRSAT